jgi:hypothetical protein
MLMLPPDGSPGQLTESLADLGKGDDLDLRFTIGADKPFVLGYIKLYMQMAMGGHRGPMNAPATMGSGTHRAPPKIH